MNIKIHKQKDIDFLLFLTTYVLLCIDIILLNENTFHRIKSNFISCRKGNIFPNK